MNNQIALKMVSEKKLEMGIFSDRERKALDIGYLLAKEIVRNWMTYGVAGEEGVEHFHNLEEDTFQEGENGGGTEEQFAILKDILLQYDDLTLVPISDESHSEEEPDIELTPSPASKHSPVISPDIVLTPSPEPESSPESRGIVTRDLDWFRRERPAQFTQAEEIVQYMRDTEDNPVPIILQAEEKTGKRVIVEIISLLTQKETPNFFVTAFGQKSAESQLAELRRYLGSENVSVLRSNAKAQETIDSFSERLARLENKCAILHIDEADYASGGGGINGEKQCLAPAIQSDRTIYRKIYYTSTCKELLLEMQGEKKHFKYVPSADYRGAEWFLEENLVKKSEPFLDEDQLGLSDFADGLVKTLTSPRPVGLVRLSKGGDYKEFKACCQPVDSRGHAKTEWPKELKIIFVDCDVENVFDPSDQSMWDEITQPTLIVLNQCWRRCTELVGHHKIKFLHDHREVAQISKSGSSWASLSQAIGRVKHYHSEGHPIEVYTDECVLEAVRNPEVLEGKKSYSRQRFTDNNKAQSIYAGE